MNLLRLHEEVATVCPIVGIDVQDGVATCIPKSEATPEQIVAAQTVINNYDDSPEADAEWQLAKNRADALGTALTRQDRTAISVRTFFNAILFLVNNRLEALGQTRVQMHEIQAFIEANPTIGDPI